MIDEEKTQRLSKRALARLITKCIKGDARAFAELYKIFINTIYYNVSATLVDKSEVEDAVQQVVVSLHKGISQLKSPYAFHAYLYRITMNVCNKYNNKAAKQQHSELAEVEHELVDDKNEAPPQALERKERDELIRQYVSKLPEKQRYTVLLYYYYDMPYKDIAKVMGTTVTVVGSNINRAKKNMKRMLEEHEKELQNIAEGDESFQGVSLDALLSAGVVSAIEGTLDPNSAMMLWQRCIEDCPGIAVGIVGAVKAASVSSTVKAVVASVATAGVVLGAGAATTQYAYDTHVEPKASPELVVSPSLFIPERVSITMVSSNPDYPETYNPVYAELDLSEGFPVGWVIVDEAGTMLFQGTGSSIDQSVFNELGRGNYRVEWTVSNEHGNLGIASREFIFTDTIEEQES